jgi:hypothetical protein
MIIDCDTCAVRGHGCADCVVTALLGPTAGEGWPGGADDGLDHDRAGPAVASPGDVVPVELDEEERRALAVLARAGLVAPLRLAAPLGDPPGHPAPTRPERRDTPTRRRAV